MSSENQSRRKELDIFLFGSSGDDSATSRFDRWVQELPKVELHAHVNGSISPQLLNTLIQEKNLRLEEKQNLQKQQQEEGTTSSAEGETSGSPAPAAAAAHITMMRDDDQTLNAIVDPSKRMAYCFTIFDTIYRVMDNLESTQLAVEDVLCAYAAENTYYLELRTSLREMSRTAEEALTAASTTTAGGGATQPPVLASRRDYVSTVWETIQRVQRDGPSGAAVARFHAIYLGRHTTTTTLPASAEGEEEGSPLLSLEEYGAFLRDGLHKMEVRLLLSINRASPVEVAEETIDIALEFAKEKKTGEGADQSSLQMVGIDLCGNCYKGTLSDFMPCLERAASHGLQLSLHAGEKDDDAEIEQMLNIKPAVGRFGHLVFINAANTKAIMDRSIPAEFCLTSNMLTSGLSGPTEHHLRDWFFPSPLSSPTCADDAKSTTTSSLPPVGSAHPLSINTDDRGVFYTSMNTELKHFAVVMAHELVQWIENNSGNNSSSKEVSVEECAEWVLQATKEVSRSALCQAFLDSDEKDRLCRVFDSMAPATTFPVSK